MTNKISPQVQSLQVLVGKQLSSVEFVQDYVQLRFDGPVLTALVWPVVSSDGRKLRYGEAEFRDVLCQRIGLTVTKVEHSPDEALEIDFEDDSAITVSLREADYVAAEALRFSVSSSEWLVL